MMNFKSFYSTHNETMAKFIDRFNAINGDNNIFLIPNKKETYANDGSFLCSDLGLAIGYDWQYKKTGYKTFGEFEYERWGLGQFGTKLVKPSIKISLQISEDESGLLVGWHQDFDKVNDVNLTSETKVNRKEPMGCTHDYMEYDISTDVGLLEFTKMIQRAFDTQTYNHTVFAS